MPILNIISLGAGIQSSALLLMALHGEFNESPDAAIFADTQWESSSTYDYLDYLDTIAEPYSFRIYRVSAGNLRQDMLDSKSRGMRVANMPLHVRGSDGRPALLRRTCTKEYKIEPIQRKVAALLHEKLGRKAYPIKSVDQWIGISTDEASRMKDSRLKYVTLRYPLIEKRMSRTDCLEWLIDHGYQQPSKSACIGCPFHSDQFWRHLKRNHPEEWANAVEFDQEIRRGIRGVREISGGGCFVHRSLKPLDQVDLRTAEDRGQLNLFLNECEGMCGV